jgi:hypothetical protein
MSRDITYTREYPEEMAGERIGWSAVAEKPDNEDVVIVDTVVATIGENGARMGHIEVQNGEETMKFTDGCDEGFLAVSGLMVIISRESGINQAGVVFSTERDERHRETILRYGAFGVTDFIPDEEQRQWADNRQEFIDNLKTAMDENEVGEHYPAVYYHLNGFIGRTALPVMRSPLGTTAPEEVFIPDRTMAETTEEQANAAQTVADRLSDAHAEDSSMKKNLTVFSNIPAEQISQEFRESRRKVREIELKALEAVNGLLASRLVYLPIGQGRGARTWPYMDALAGDEAMAFKHELQMLEAKIAEPVSRELDREMRELKSRINYAQDGTQVLRLLNRAEGAEEL